jgi:hypothetical protein
MLVGFIATTSATANYYELLRRVPESANTIILIDVERMLMSPIAMKENWREKGNSEGVTLHFPINAVRYMLASKLDATSNFEDLGNIALIEATESLSLPRMAKTEGGYLDTVDGQQIAYSPRNAFFVSLEPTILGVSFPANRQDLSRWLRSLKRLDQPQVSDYLQQAVKLAHGKDQMVVAFDLTDLFTPRMIRDRLHHAESLAGKDVDLDVLTKVLASAKGVTLTMEATERLNGKLQLDLGESPTPIKEVARVLILEVLENRGLLLDEMKDWRLLVEAKAITLEGRMTSHGLKRLTELIPFPVDTVDLKQAGGKQGERASEAAAPSSPGNLQVTASKKYYDRITERLKDLRVELRGAQKAKFAQKMLNDASHEIDRLPVLNVDEELLAYGAGVSSSLRGMRNLSKTAGLDYQYRTAQIQGNASSGYGYGYGGFYGGGSVAGATTSTYRQETALLQANELEVLNMLEEKTAEIRRKMTLKYQVEF